jgi:hypothetical protein
MKKTAFFRASKSGMHGQKFHLGKHYPDVISEFSNVKIVDTSHSERKHKAVKMNFRNTSKRKATAEREVTGRMEISDRVEAINRMHDLRTYKETKVDIKSAAAIDPKNNKPRLVFFGK